MRLRTIILAGALSGVVLASCCATKKPIPTQTKVIDHTAESLAHYQALVRKTMDMMAEKQLRDDSCLEEL